MVILLSISAIWLLSEIILAIAKRDKSAQANKLDKSSLRYLWIAITVSITMGVLIGVKGIGRIPLYSQGLSTAGIMLIIAGLAIRWWAIIALRKYFTVNIAIKDGHKIIDTSIYGWIRHPAYSGSLLSFLGLGLSFSNWLSMIVIFVPIAVSFTYRIYQEEKALAGVFGNAYADYMKRTWRLVPYIY